MLFDEAQEQISLDHTGYTVTYPHLPCDKPHMMDDSLHCIHPPSCPPRLTQVGVATSSKKLALQADAEKHCNLIADSSFWNGLEIIIGDIEPICYATNINQTDCTCLDQVLLTLIGMYLHFTKHLEPTVQDGMKKQLEK